MSDAGVGLAGRRARPPRAAQKRPHRTGFDVGVAASAGPLGWTTESGVARSMEWSTERSMDWSMDWSMGGRT